MDLLIVNLRSKNQVNMTQRAGAREVARTFSKINRLPGLHQIDITQIIALTDYELRLQFVTASLDCSCKVIQVEDNEDEPVTISYEILSSGEIINAVALHGPTSLFCVSTFDSETDQSYVQVWRRRIKQGEYGPFDCMTLDFKLIEKNFLCMPDPQTGGAKLVALKV